MKLFDLIERARSEPEKHRQTIALVVSLILTVIIFGFWLAGFKNDLSQRASVGEANTPSPWAALKETFNGAR